MRPVICNLRGGVAARPWPRPYIRTHRGGLGQLRALFTKERCIGKNIECGINARSPGTLILRGEM